ncbi:MAG: hypothetical protein KA521_08185 [Crocinitomicaceae bacterium]|nr:hypothetical protein [Crocinitomicaceae bacterium]
MTALKTLGILCIILVCFGGAITVIVGVFQKPKPTKIDKDGKRELKINRINYWEYLIIILPVSLLLIGLFTNDREEKLTSYIILGLGYAYLLLSPYNNRIDVPWVKRTVLITCVTLAIVSVLLSKTYYNFNFQSGLSALTVLWFPLMTTIYLLSARQIIKLTTKTYPLTLDRYFRVGHFSNRLNRKATYWDLTWTLWNIAGFPATIIYILVITK